ncbi:MAG TPA: metallopeptidase TldD-related protein [Steroidobacteraceae bacterium]|jgi:predicted Zn-dependent protease|nr:metallopeptidase TldD-related protein [Steroidobacteraceae bacterium]
MKLPGMKVIACCGALLLSPLVRADEDVVSRALHDEMQRSMQKLQLDQLSKPYFISYLVLDNDISEVSATLGSVVSSIESKSRILLVTVKVGDYALDSSNFLSMPSGPQGISALVTAGAALLPLDDNYNELRRKIWLTTDRAYKKALEDFSGKQAALQNRNRSENLADFSKAIPVSISETPPRADLDAAAATRLVRETSGVFRQTPSVETSLAQLVMSNRQERYLNSEGSSFVRRVPHVSLRVSAVAQAPDGMALSDFIMLYGYSLKDLPGGAALMSRVRDLQNEIVKLQAAPLQERYEGPVLFEGQAAAEAFSRHFAAGLTAVPALISGNDQLAQAFRAQSGGMLDKIGSRVLPAFINVTDDPTATREKDALLFGGHMVDEEATVPQRTSLVEHGVLKTLLTSRAPVHGIAVSTGSERELGVAPSNLFVSADQTQTSEELRRRLIQSAKEQGRQYGILVRRLSGKTATLAYRIYPDGHEELVRNAVVEDLTPANMKEIAAVSDQRVVYTEAAPVKSSPFNLNLFAGGRPLVSYVVPAFLFNDLTIEKPNGETPKRTVLSNPLAEKP